MDPRDGTCSNCGRTCRAIGQQLNPGDVPVFSPDIAMKTAFWCPVCRKVFCGNCCGTKLGVSTQKCPICNGVPQFASIEHWNEQKNSSTGCFIATAACGSNSYELKILHSFRDNVLRKSIFGRLFIRVYLNISPPIASLIEKSLRIQYLVRKAFILPIAKFITVTDSLLRK